MNNFKKLLETEVIEEKAYTDTKKMEKVVSTFINDVLLLTDGDEREAGKQFGDSMANVITSTQVNLKSTSEFMKGVANTGFPG